jgi:hypothetical protein
VLVLRPIGFDGSGGSLALDEDFLVFEVGHVREV